MSAVAVVIPTLRGAPGLPAVVASLRAEGAEVRIADNGLPADDVRSLAASGATIDPMGVNAGFGRAVNASAAESAARSLVVLNDDIIPRPGFLAALLSGLEGAAMAAGVLLKHEAPELVETAGVVVDRHLGCYDHLQDRPVRAIGPRSPAPLGPCGGAAAFRRSAFDAVGGFDPGFFAYYEDVDLALRLRARGEGCALAWEAQAVHRGSATLGYHSLEKATIVAYSRGRLLRKHAVLRTAPGAAWVLGTESLVVAALARRHRSLGPGFARLRGFLDCDERAGGGRAAVADVGLREGLRRKHRRSRRETTA